MRACMRQSKLAFDPSNHQAFIISKSKQECPAGWSRFPGAIITYPVAFSYLIMRIQNLSRTCIRSEPQGPPNCVAPIRQIEKENCKH
jgi:hypothetical protein